MSIRIAIIVSEFNEAITTELKNGAYQQLIKKGVPPQNIKVVSVPGAVEIPLTAKWPAATKQYDALIALGCVIRGETSHYDYVCAQVSEGCQRVMLDNNIPVIFGVLTTENDAQAFARLGGEEGHKGIDAANAALSMIELKTTI